MKVLVVTTKKSDFIKAVRAFAAGLLEKDLHLKTALVVTLNGELGAGKTTFVQELGRILGAHGRILSPTFIVVRSHEITKEPWTTLHHMDCYRLKTASELGSVGWKEMYADPRAIICVEWGERVKSALPRKRIDIEIEGNKNPTHRTLSFNFHGL